MEFNIEDILWDIKVEDKDDLFKKIASHAKKFHIIKDETSLIEAFKEREAEVSTGLQDSFAIPHAKTSTVKEPKIYFVRLHKPIEWETFDDKPVQNIFCLLVPKEYEGVFHLELISKLATLLLEKDFKKKLYSSQNKENILSIIQTALKGGI